MFNNSCYVLADGECVSPLPCAHGDPMGVDEFVVKVESAGCASDAFRWITAKALSAWTAAPLSTLPERPDEEIATRLRAYAKNLAFDGLVLRSEKLRVAAERVDELAALRSRLSSLERELDGVRKDAERLDFLDDRTHLYEAPVLDCYAGDRYEVTIGDAKDPLIGNGASLREAIDAAMSALRERSE